MSINFSKASEKIRWLILIFKSNIYIYVFYNIPAGDYLCI